MTYRITTVYQPFAIQSLKIMIQMNPAIRYAMDAIRVKAVL